ncbi:transporter substrate-binding domain-containing protein [Deferribacterales bacterium Es71-Z0220]|uniref:transporter substrate-binding domain-containing protein n=1 Tax=Deferrivibrio essentukiensis TaxID=2880922 RepID=UPI001F61D698|nr:transporter substrate-binding domain-containing protein [Deferrivibrio essentukiensis]MCB4204110.1 transporter substrate-binding domain-containing protein [Deferrivibrio essentukiensis]
MKVIIWVILSILFFFSQGFSDNLNICYSEYKPFVYKDNLGNLKGFDVDLISGFCSQNKYDCSFVSYSFSQLLKNVEEKQCDVAIGSIYVTAKRKELGLFTSPYLNSGLVAVVKNEFDSSYESLMDKTVGVKLNSTGNILADKMALDNKHLSVKIYKSTYDSFMALQSGDVNWVINDYYNSLDIIYSFFRGEFKILTLNNKPLFLEKSEIAFYLPVSQKKLLEKINIYIDRLQKNGEMDILIHRWFYITKPITIKEYLINTIILTSSLLIGVFFILISIVLKVKNTRLKSYNAFLESSLDLPLMAIIAFDYNGKIIFWNKGAEKLIGFKEGEISNLGELLLGKNEFIKLTTPCNTKINVKTKNKEKSFYVSVFNVKFNDADFILFGLDITETMEAISTSLLYENMYYSIIENSPNGVMLIEDEKVYLNKTSQEWFSLFDKYISVNELPANIKDILDKFKESGEKKKVYSESSQLIENKIIDANLIKLKIEDNLFYLIILIDFTEKYQHQKFIEIVQKDEALTNVVSSVVHDVNNLLGIIINYASILQLKKMYDESSAIKIIEVAEQCAQFLKSLNNISKTSEEKKVVEIDGFLLSKYDFLKQIVRPKVDLKIEIISKGGKLLANEQKLFQVILNLVINSKDAIQNNGQIIIRKSFQKNMLHIEVEDNGEGIPEEMADKIFNKFFTTKENLGTGLGLYATKIFVEEIGGNISFKSKRGAGTIFYLDFEAIE